MDQTDRRFELFAAFLAVAMLLQLASVSYTANELRAGHLIGFVELLQLFAALAVFWRPTPKRAAFAACAQLLNFGLSLPHMPNHRLVTAAVNAGLLLALATRPPSPAELFRRYAPAVRCSVVVVYFFAVFHKLNFDFINPATSCTTPFFKHVLDAMPLLPGSGLLFAVLPWLTLVIESAIPLLLCFQRTRLLGVLLAFFFHSVLALDVEKHFFDFTSTMFALVSTFLPLSFLSRASELFGDRPVPSLRACRFIFTVWYVASMAAALAGTYPGYQLFFAGRQLLWWSLNALLAYVLLVAAWRWKAERIEFRPQYRVLLAVPLFLVINGFEPYLGVKTRSALDMYSNLRVEGPNPNHLIFRRPLDIFGNLNDLVRLKATSDAALANEYVDSGLLLTFFELRRYTSTHPDISVTYERNGVEHRVERAGDDPELNRRWPLILEKLLWYRPVDSNPHARCQW